MHDLPSLARRNSPAEDATPALWVHDAVLAQLAEVPARPWEVGGWLLGYWSADQQSVFVTHATPPAGRGTPFGVRISGRGHRRRFDEAWAASAGHVTYLGDWHTHPGSAAVPSARDLTALRQLATDPAYGTPRPLAAIVHTPRWPLLSKGATEVRWHVLPAKDALPTELSIRISSDLPDVAASVLAWRETPWRQYYYSPRTSTQ